MKLSLLLPCHYSQRGLLIRSLEGYVANTRIPEEVIITIDEKPWYAFFLESMINNRFFDRFPKIVVHSCRERLTSERQQKLSSERATGDVLIFHDVTEFPHPQRIAIIDYWFQKNNTTYLSHCSGSSSHDMQLIPSHQFALTEERCDPIPAPYPIQPNYSIRRGCMREQLAPEGVVYVSNFLSSQS